MDDFDAVSWRSPPRTHDGTDDEESELSSPTSAGLDALSNTYHSEEPQAGINPDRIGLAGVGPKPLVTTVSDPATENDGTKDAYVSYLVTTEVRS